MPPKRLNRNGGNQGWWLEIKEALVYLKRNKVVLGLLVLFVLPMMANISFMSLLPAFSIKILGVGASKYGLLQAAPGMGAVISLLALATLGNMRRRGLFLFIAGMSQGLALLAFAASRQLAVAMPLLAVVGTMSTTFITVDSTLVQSTISDDIRGRVTSLRDTLRGLTPVGSILAGVVSDLANPAVGMAALGATIFLAPLTLIFLMPQVRRLQ